MEADESGDVDDATADQSDAENVSDMEDDRSEQIEVQVGKQRANDLPSVARGCFLGCHVSNCDVTLLRAMVCCQGGLLPLRSIVFYPEPLHQLPCL